MLLQVGIDNARYQLERAIPAYAEGRLGKARDAHAIAVLFRKHGVCSMLSVGDANPVFVAQMQSAAAYLHRLVVMPEEDKVTSWAGAFWDAVGGEYWDAAADIARKSRTTPNRSWEHEDDFLYVAFLMSRYFLGPKSDSGADVHQERQRELLDRWTLVLEGNADPRLDLCESLLNGDAEGFRAALVDVGVQRRAKLEAQVREGVLPEDEAAWFVPYWGEGLALLRFAELDGLETDDHVAMVPNLVRAKGPFAYGPTAWKRIDFKPLPRRLRALR